MRHLVLPIALLIAAPALADEALVLSGVFQDADQRHQGAGGAELVLTDAGALELRLGEDFAVTPGPDLEVWLVGGEVPNTSTAVLEGSYVSLGPLETPEGAQSYPIPEDAELEDFSAAIIWCEDFSVLFAIAPLEAMVAE